MLLVTLLLLFYSAQPIAAQTDYIAISFDETADEEAIAEKLREGGIEDFSGESTAWVLLNTFGALEKVPLPRYAGRVLPFDPRNDGYAEELRGFFVHDGRRHLYIPVSGQRAVFESRVEQALDGIPFAFEGGNAVSPFAEARAAFASAAATGAAPPLAASRLTAALALLLILFMLLPPWRGFLAEALATEFFARRTEGAVFTGLLRRRETRALFLKTAIAAAFYLGICLVGGTPLVAALAFLVLFFAAAALPLVPGFCAGGKTREQEEPHIPFLPVPIMSALPPPRRRKAGPLALTAIMTAGAFAAPPASAVTTLPDKAAYAAHARNQSLFPFQYRGGEAGQYFDVTLGEDGLIDGYTLREDVPPGFEAPEYPFEDLALFLETARPAKRQAAQVSGGAGVRHIVSSGIFETIFPLAAVLVLFVVFSAWGLRGHGRSRKNPLYRNLRIV